MEGKYLGNGVVKLRGLRRRMYGALYDCGRYIRVEHEVHRPHLIPWEQVLWVSMEV